MNTFVVRLHSKDNKQIVELEREDVPVELTYEGVVYVLVSVRNATKHATYKEKE